MFFTLKLVSEVNSQLIPGADLTWEGQHGLEVTAVGDAGAVLGAGVPQVLKLPLRDDDAAGHRGDLPVVVSQRHAGDQEANQAHDEPRCLHCRRHGGNAFGKLLKMKHRRKTPSTEDDLRLKEPLLEAWRQKERAASPES